MVLYPAKKPHVSIVLYAIGSPIVSDVAESCARLGLPIAAWVKNIPDKTYENPGQQVINAQDVSPELTALEFVVPLFTPRHRQTAVEDARKRGFSRPRTLIDPTSVVASSTIVGPGCYLNSGANIGAAGRIGQFVFVNRSASVGHHSEIADYVSIGPGAVIAGGVYLGFGVLIAAGAIILPGMEIGERAVVAAGSVVTRPVPPRSLVMGNPAKIVRSELPIATME
jgi:sugar O-acyltransferase (sialic acid O-acetyltransferase NeuD family)